MQSVAYLKTGTQTGLGATSTGYQIISTLAMLLCYNNVISKDKVKAEGLKESTQHT